MKSKKKAFASVQFVLNNLQEQLQKNGKEKEKPRILQAA